jgi:ribosomal protein L29
MSGFLTRFAPACPCPQELFMMRKNVKTRQQVKPHLFMHTKHRVAQLQSLLSQRQAA